MSNQDALQILLQSGEEIMGGSDPFAKGSDPVALKERLAVFQDTTTFAVGDLVMWKPGLRNKKVSVGNTPAIVSVILDEPVLDISEKGPSSPYYREPLDIKIGLIDSDGDYIEFHMDSRRLQLYFGE